MKKIFEKIDQSRKLIIKLQRELTSRIAIGPENGGDGEYNKTIYVKSIIEKLDPDMIKEILVPDKRVSIGYRPNLIAKWQKAKDKPIIWILTHSDIVPPGDLSLWSSDPYKVKVEGNKIIGRGVEDNQHAFVSFYIAIKSIMETDKDMLKNPTGLVFVADEETGSEYGLKYILENHNDIFKKEDLIIVPDGGNEDGTMIEVAEKSMLWLKFIVHGMQCHASTPDRGKNSLYASAKLITQLVEILKKEFFLQDNLFEPSYSTFEPTKIEENVKNINTIPGKSIFYMDCRIIPFYKLNNVFNQIKNIANKVDNELSIKTEIEPVYWLEAPEPTPINSPVVKALSKAIEKIKGKKAVPKGIGGGTVAAFFRKKGFPAVVWSTVSDTAHKPDEYCLISNIIEDAKIFAYLMMH